MTRDIKATVEELERQLAELASDRKTVADSGFHDNYTDAARARNRIANVEQRCLIALPSLLAELRRCWDMIERARKESKTDGDMQRLISDFSLRSDNHAMARELEQASAKLVEQQNVIVRLRAIEEAALHLREVQCAGYLVSGLTHHKAREALFAALPPRKEGA